MLWSFQNVLHQHPKALLKPEYNDVRSAVDRHGCPMAAMCLLMGIITKIPTLY